MTADLQKVAPQAGQLTWRNFANLGAFAVNALFTLLSSNGYLGPDNTALSFKYTLLITPAGFAFSIWGFIFLWEGIFAIAQMTPMMCSSKVVELVTPGWVLACIAQAAWSIFFAQEFLVVACISMLAILAGLFLIAFATDGMQMSWSEWLVLRGCFSLHGGWIVAASALNVSVVAEGRKAAPEIMLGLTVGSVGVICVFATIFALAKHSPDPIVCCVAAWAFNAISAKLSDPVDLNSDKRFNPYTWDPTTLKGLEIGASYIVYVALILAAVAATRGIYAMFVSPQRDSDQIKELSNEMVQQA